jgi:hypothetical protein
LLLVFDAAIASACPVSRETGAAMCKFRRAVLLIGMKSRGSSDAHRDLAAPSRRVAYNTISKTMTFPAAMPCIEIVCQLDKIWTHRDFSILLTRTCP